MHSTVPQTTMEPPTIHHLRPRKGGLAVAFVVPGTGLLTAGGIGTALLLRKAQPGAGDMWGWFGDG